MQTKDNAKKLRKIQTPEESLLWKRLKDRRLSIYKFRRQATIDEMIVDFCCFEKRLIIELDGFQHKDHKSTDKARGNYLKAQGFRVIRFWNGEIHKNIETVLDKIIEALETPSSGRPPK